MLLATGSSTTSTPYWWVPLVVAGITALVAMYAGISANRANARRHKAEVEATRLREREGRLDQRKVDTYQPVIELLRDVMDSAKPGGGVTAPAGVDLLQTMSKFSTWIMVWGSDEAIRAFRNWRQAGFHDAPGDIAMRLYAEFTLAARRDMGYPDTTITVTEFLGMRINDIHDRESVYNVGRLSLRELASNSGWQIPWERVPVGDATDDVPPVPGED